MFQLTRIAMAHQNVLFSGQDYCHSDTLSGLAEFPLDCVHYLIASMSYYGSVMGQLPSVWDIFPTTAISYLGYPHPDSSHVGQFPTGQFPLF